MAAKTEVTVIRYSTYRQFALSIHRTGCRDIDRDRRQNGGHLYKYLNLAEALEEWCDEDDDLAFLEDEVNILPCVER